MIPSPRSVPRLGTLEAIRGKERRWRRPGRCGRSIRPANCAADELADVGIDRAQERSLVREGAAGEVRDAVENLHLAGRPCLSRTFQKLSHATRRSFPCRLSLRPARALCEPDWLLVEKIGVGCKRSNPLGSFYRLGRLLGYQTGSRESVSRSSSKKK